MKTVRACRSSAGGSVNQKIMNLYSKPEIENARAAVLQLETIKTAFKHLQFLKEGENSELVRAALNHSSPDFLPALDEVAISFQHWYIAAKHSVNVAYYYQDWFITIDGEETSLVDFVNNNDVYGLEVLDQIYPLKVGEFVMTGHCGTTEIKRIL